MKYRATYRCMDCDYEETRTEECADYMMALVKLPRWIYPQLWVGSHRMRRQGGPVKVS